MFMAEIKEISCSADLPPNMMATRFVVFMRQSYSNLWVGVTELLDSFPSETCKKLNGRKAVQ